MSLRHLPCLFSLCLLLMLCPAHGGAAEGPATGFQNEVMVKEPTRLDWKFVASGFGPEALQLPPDYDSRRQRFQLFVPREYSAKKSWPLLVFVSPGDDPLGWKYWQKTCEARGMLFCAAYGAGNNCPAGKRIRIVLDMLDHVRRHYQIDPDQTYVSGFSGGGRVACTIGYNLPEYFGGVVPCCGTNPLPPLTYLRHRVRDRLSVAFVTGARDFNRAENEQYMAPYFKDLAIRSRLWVAADVAHALPGPAVLDEVVKWLADDLERRRRDTKDRPRLAVPPDTELTPETLAARILAGAEAELKIDERSWHGVALLQGVKARWEKTEAGQKAAARLKEIVKDEPLMKRIEEQGGQEERAGLTAQAQALERFGQLAGALQAWQLLAEQHAFSPEGRKALNEARRLTRILAQTPFLGVTFNGDSTVVDRLVPDGPADRAGLRSGDRIVTFAGQAVKTGAALRKELDKHKPGEKVKLEVERQGQKVALNLEVGSAAPVQEK